MADATYGNVMCAFWSRAERKELRSGLKCEGACSVATSVEVLEEKRRELHQKSLEFRYPSNSLTQPRTATS